ncbi:MAG: hypothetical protein J5905_02615 [Prevotella sp.]|nr:hypothetical protein [Prevotella sp.]
MKKLTKYEERPFFLSWSDAQSKDVAIVLREFLCQVFLIPEEDIFVSDSDLTGTMPMVEKISEIASNSKIEIICLTKENCEKPWIHYELGISSCKNHKTSKLILPVCFNLGFKDIPTHLSMITQKEVVCANEIGNSKIGDVSYYVELLRRLIFHIDSFLIEKMLKLKHYRVNHFKNINDKGIGTYDRYINKTARKLNSIFKTYDVHELFISRPMQGASSETNQRLYEILCDIEQEFIGKVKIYFSKNEHQNSNLPFSRIDIIKTSRSFIMLYPQILDGDKYLPPSSCLVELGAAMAFNLDIKIYAQFGSKLPEFLNDKYKVFSIEYFHDIDDVRRMLVDYIKNSKMKR